MTGTNNNAKTQKSRGKPSLTEMQSTNLLELMTSQIQLMSAQIQASATQSDLMAEIVNQNSQLMTQVQNLTDLLAEQLEPDDEKSTRNLDD